MNTATVSHRLSEGLEILFDGGSGRVYITIVDDDQYLPLARAIGERLCAKARSVVIRSESVTASSWSALSTALRALIAQLGVRQASLIGMGAGATLAQNLALTEPKTVRSMAVIDAAARPHPSRWERLIDALEARLPFGLPLRLGSNGFNVRSYLHRFRSPLLVVCTRRAGAFIREEVRQLAELAPTAWFIDLSQYNQEEESAHLAETITSFQETPVKCPQKSFKEQS